MACGANSEPESCEDSGDTDGEGSGDDAGDDAGAASGEMESAIGPTPKSCVSTVAFWPCATASSPTNGHNFLTQIILCSLSSK